MIEWFQQLLQQFGQALQAVLPLSPFRSYIDAIAVPQWLGLLNWLFPVAECVTIFAAWLVAYGTYLLYRIILRWVKAVS